MFGFGGLEEWNMKEGMLDTLLLDTLLLTKNRCGCNGEGQLGFFNFFR